jgi:hypothetical protein
VPVAVDTTVVVVLEPLLLTVVDATVHVLVVMFVVVVVPVAVETVTTLLDRPPVLAVVVVTVPVLVVVVLDVRTAPERLSTATSPREFSGMRLRTPELAALFDEVGGTFCGGKSTPFHEPLATRIAVTPERSSAPVTALVSPVAVFTTRCMPLKDTIASVPTVPPVTETVVAPVAAILPSVRAIGAEAVRNDQVTLRSMPIWADRTV